MNDCEKFRHDWPKWLALQRIFFDWFGFAVPIIAERYWKLNDHRRRCKKGCWGWEQLYCSTEPTWNAGCKFLFPSEEESQPKEKEQIVILAATK